MHQQNHYCATWFIHVSSFPVPEYMYARTSTLHTISRTQIVSFFIYFLSPSAYAKQAVCSAFCMHVHVHACMLVITHTYRLVITPVCFLCTQSRPVSLQIKYVCMYVCTNPHVQQLTIRIHRYLICNFCHVQFVLSASRLGKFSLDFFVFVSFCFLNSYICSALLCLCFKQAHI